MHTTDRETETSNTDYLNRPFTANHKYNLKDILKAQAADIKPNTTDANPQNSQWYL